MPAMTAPRYPAERPFCRRWFVVLAGVLAASFSVNAQPRRIVSTAPSITEILYALGLGDSVVGDTTFCTYPPEARNKPKVGTFLQPDLERILALRPTLVLVIKNPIGVTAKLRSLGLHAEELDQDSVAGIRASITQVGELTGRRNEAARLNASLETQFAEVRALAAKYRRPSVLFLVGRAPGTLQGMVGAGGGTFIDELLQLAGANNALAGSAMQYPNVSLEQILTRDPDVILDMGDFAHAEGRPGQPEPQVLALWSAYPRLRAVQQQRVRVIASDVFVRPGPRMGEAARALFQLVHPEAATAPPERKADGTRHP